MWSKFERRRSGEYPRRVVPVTRAEVVLRGGVTRTRETPERTLVGSVARTAECVDATDGRRPRNFRITTEKCEQLDELVSNCRRVK